MFARLTACTTLAATLSVCLAGCGTIDSVQRSVLGGPQLGSPVDSGTFIGAVAADEPRAVLIGKQILADGGSAADAAAAVGFALAVTLPSRAGLGAGGACLAFSPARTGGAGPEAILFTAPAPAATAGDRPAAVPMLARGLFAVQGRYGVLPMARDIAPAERLAGFGAPVSRAFAQDLAVVGPALLADPPAAAIFGPRSVPLDEGEQLIQLDLSATLARLRVQGVADLYVGQLARRLVSLSPAVGGPLTAADLQAALVRTAEPITLRSGPYAIAFLPPPADGGLAAAAAFQRLQSNPKDIDGAQAAAIAAATTWRHGRADASAILAGTASHPADIGQLPASTSFVTLDRTGGAVACAVSMGNLFGTGRIVPGTGMMLAASPAKLPLPMLAAALATNAAGRSFRAAIAGSGQAGAGLAVALGITRTLAAKSAMPSAVPEPGRINAIACPDQLPGPPGTCSWATDPRNAGLASGGGA